MQPLPRSPEWNKLFRMMENPEFTELQVNAYDMVFVKQKGKRIRVKNIEWEDEDAYMESVKTDLADSGFVKSDVPFDELGALFEGPVAWTSERGKTIRGRFHIVLPPASDTPLITFAKKTQSLVTLDNIYEGGAMSQQMLRFIKAAIHAQKSIVFSGSTGAGKTTMLEACTKLFLEGQRIAVCEDTPELVLKQKNVAYMHSLPWRPGMDEKNVATLSWVVQQVNRMRTDKVIVGETRGKEFADFLTAANSGMEGSMTTIHANNPRECLGKMSNFTLKGSGENVPIKSVNEDINSAVDLIIQLHYDKKSGRYLTTQIEEVTGPVADNASASISSSTLWKYSPENDTHEHLFGISDSLRNDFINAGLDPTEFTIVNSMGAGGNEPAWLEGHDPNESKSSRQIGTEEVPRSSRKSAFGGRPDKNRGIPRSL